MYRQALIWEASSTLRHDLRNKFASLRNASAYLHKRVERDAPNLAAADQRVPVFFALIDKELTLADEILSTQIPGLGGPATLELLELEPLVDEALAAAAVPERIEVVRGARTGAHAFASRELAVAVFCLLENAIEAIADRGTITVTCRVDGEHAILEIADSGPGLAASIAERAIESGITTKPGRSGLGLPIARRMAVRSRGTLQLSTGPGLRATITTGVP